MSRKFIVLSVVVVAIATFASLQSCKRDMVFTDICFQRDIAPIFTSNCTNSGCHDAVTHEKGYDLTTYDGIMKGIRKKSLSGSEIWEVINDGSMPKNGTLSDDAKMKIKKWILAGAPNTTSCSSLCDTNTFTYSAGVDPIIAVYCRGCHTNANPSGTVSLETYTDVVNTQNAGLLLGAIRHENGFVPMPYNASSLSDCQIRVIEKWVAAGMPQ